MENNITYPIYRKLINNRSYYKILSKFIFEEIQCIGSKKKHYIHEAKQYPEMLFIQDLIYYSHAGISEYNQEDWNKLFQ
jgi:hypothetical protein